MPREIPFVIETNACYCVIHESRNNEKRLEIAPGEASANRIRAIAYQLLAMVGE